MNFKSILKTATLTTVIAFTLTACGEKNYTVEDFKKDEKLTNEYRQKCRNGELDRYGLVCENAYRAYEHFAYEKRKKREKEKPQEELIFSTSKSISDPI